MNEHDEHDYHEWHPAATWFFKVLKIAGVVIGGVLLAVLLAFVFGYFVMWLWNWLMPGLFGLKMITFWQAFGLIVLAKIFFGGAGSHGSYGHHRSDKWEHKRWKHHFKHNFGSEWAPGGDFSNMKYYEDYWKSEGKASFEAYLNKIKSEENKDK